MADLADRFGKTFINVRDDYGARGDGSTDDTAALQAALNAAFAGGTAQRRLVLPPGKFIVKGGGLTGRNWMGGCLQGSGRFATEIQNADGGPVFSLNGCQYMRFEDMQLDGSGGGHTLFDLDWDGTGTALQSNTFMNMMFSDAGVGVHIAKSGFMGSENLFLTCFFSNLVSRGLQIDGFNALQQTVIGGDFQTCGIGINVNSGSCDVIDGVGFQQNGWDIQIDGASGNIMTVTGCRTESPNFINNAGTQSMSIRGCNQTAPTRGLFYTGAGGQIHISGCMFNGQVDPRGWTRACIQSCVASSQAVPGDWLQKNVNFWWYVPNNSVSLVLELENIWTTLAVAGTDQQIGKQRLFTSDGKMVTTQNYVLQ
jgi:hypothetical protein